MFRLVRWLLVPIVIIAVLFVGANILAAHIAEDRIASTLQSTFHLSSKPTVHISGFPIIIDVLQGHVPRVSFHANGATFEGLDLIGIDVSLVDVRAASGSFFSGSLSVRVGAGTVKARATDGAVTAFLGDHGQNATIAFHNGRATVRSTRTFLGSRHAFVASGPVGREGNAFVFRPDSVSIDGAPAPPGVRQAAERRMTIRVQLPKLPGGVSAYRIEAVEGAATIVAVLHDQLLDLSG